MSDFEKFCVALCYMPLGSVPAFLLGLANGGIGQAIFHSAGVKNNGDPIVKNELVALAAGLGYVLVMAPTIVMTLLIMPTKTAKKNLDVTILALFIFSFFMSPLSGYAGAELSLSRKTNNASNAGLNTPVEYTVLSTLIGAGITTAVGIIVACIVGLYREENSHDNERRYVPSTGGHVVVPVEPFNGISGGQNNFATFRRQPPMYRYYNDEDSIPPSSGRSGGDSPRSPY